MTWLSSTSTGATKSAIREALPTAMPTLRSNRFLRAPENAEAISAVAPTSATTMNPTNAGVIPGLLFSGKTGTPPAGRFVWTPDKSSQGPVSIILSAPDRKVYVYRNGVEIGRAPVAGLETARISGTYVYSADANTDSSGRRDWISTVSVGRRAPNLKDLQDRISIDSNFLQDVRALINPGTTLVVTDAPVSSQTHSGPGFNILTADAQ
jgi:hypothetical protein